MDRQKDRPTITVSQRGAALVKDAMLNKGTAFTREEREAFGLVGMLPDHVSTMDEQMTRVRDQFDRKPSDMERNIYLNSLMDRNETLFHRFALENLEEIVPIMYTPTVAEACRHWSRIYRRGRGVYLTPRDRGRMTDVLASTKIGERPVIVATDNERILGIGDQGAGGMGIPIGKLALYTAGAGIHPSRCLPVSIDVGTNNAELLADPLYVGYREHRLRGPEYDSLIDEFVAAVKAVYPGALVQWEDFANVNSFDVLQRHRDAVPSFNDDIQGTAAIVVAGLMAAQSHTGVALRDQRVVIVGAGSAGVGIRDLLALGMRRQGASGDEVAERLWVLDSRGLVIEGRDDLTPLKRRVAAPRGAVSGWSSSQDPVGLTDVVANTRATVLIGVSGVPGVFSEEAVRLMSKHADRPIVMPLSNPTSHSEATPAAVLDWTDGAALVATGSPFGPVSRGERSIHVGQANNVFVFPGIGLGALAVGASRITDEMLLAAGEALGGILDADLFGAGRLFPNITAVRDVARVVALAVARCAIDVGVAEDRDGLEELIDEDVWYPEYSTYEAG